MHSITFLKFNPYSSFYVVTNVNKIENTNLFVQPASQPANQLAYIPTFSKVLYMILKIQRKYGQDPYRIQNVVERL